MKFTDVSLSDITVARVPGKSNMLVTCGGKPLRFQVPKMYMPFGVSGKSWDGKPPSYNIDFAIEMIDGESEFYNWIKEVERVIVAQVQQLSRGDLGPDKSLDQVMAFFNSNLKENAQYGPKLRVKFDTVWGVTPPQMKCNVFDDKSAPRSDQLVDGLYARAHAVALVEIDAVYFMNRKFGLTWRTHQLKVFEPETETSQQQTLTGFQFV